MRPRSPTPVTIHRVIASLVAALLLALGLATDSATAASLEQQPGCRFVLGFATLRELVGAAAVGDCLEDERHNPENGDTLQRTTGGLLVWRKADNWTAFTDGHRSWINGPFGLQTRLNTERLPWEGPSRLSWPSRPVTADEAATSAHGEVVRILGVRPTDVVVARVEAVEWSDASLGCRQPGSVYAQAIHPGYRVLLTAAGRTVHVHATPGRALLCPGPTQ